MQMNAENIAAQFFLEIKGSETENLILIVNNIAGRFMWLVKKPMAC